MSANDDLLGAFELHDPQGIRKALQAGVSPTAPLLDAGADVDLRLRGLVRSEGLEWETVVFDVTPISYAQCGLYRQFHRDEKDIYGNIDHLYRRRFGSPAPRRNIPNRYVFGH